MKNKIEQKKENYIDIEEIFSSYMKENNFFKLNGENIFPDHYSNTLFNIAGVNPLRKYFTQQENPEEKKLFSIQQCIRVNDIEEVGDKTHLTNFKMLGIFILEKFKKEELIDLVYKFLFKIGFKEKDLIISVYTEEKKIYEYINKTYKIKKIYYDSSNLWFTKNDDMAGTCVEIFVEYKNEIIEIGNIVFTCGFLKNEKFQKSNFLFADVGLGCERIETIINKLDNVYKIKKYREFSNFVTDKIKQEKERRIFLDHIITFDLLIKNFIFPGAKLREYVCKKIIRSLSRIINNHFVYKRKEQDGFIIKISELCSYKNKLLIQGLLKKELELIKNSHKEAIKYISNIDSKFVTSEQVNFCLETIGIGKQELREVIDNVDKVAQLGNNKTNLTKVFKLKNKNIILDDFFLKNKINIYDNLIEKKTKILTTVSDIFEENGKTYIKLEKNIVLPTTIVLKNKIKFVFDLKAKIKKNNSIFPVKPEFVKIKNKSNILCFNVTKIKENFKINDKLELEIDKTCLDQFEQKIISLAVLNHAIRQFDPHFAIKNLTITPEKNEIIFFSSVKLENIKKSLETICKKTLENISNAKIMQIKFSDISKYDINPVYLDSILENATIVYKKDIINEQLICWVAEKNINNIFLNIDSFLIKNEIENKLEFSISNTNLINNFQKQNNIIEKVLEIISSSNEENIIDDIYKLKKKNITILHQLENIYKFVIEKLLSKMKKNYFLLVNKNIFCLLNEIKIPKNVIILYVNKNLKETYYCLTTSQKPTEIKIMINKKRFLGKIEFLFRNNMNVSFTATKEIINELEYNNSIWINLNE